MNIYNIVFLFIVLNQSYNALQWRRSLRRRVKIVTVAHSVSLPTPPPPSEEYEEEEVKKGVIIIKKSRRELDGYDGRFLLPLNDSDAAVAANVVAAAETEIFMEKFREMCAKKELLCALENPDIPSARKLEMLPPQREIRRGSICPETLDW